jgi:hypothetical protein
MGGRPKGIRQRRAGTERQGCDDFSSDLGDDVRTPRRREVLELGETVERFVVLNPTQPQDHRLGRRIGGRLTLPPEVRVSKLPIEIPLVVPQHHLSEGWMHHKPCRVTST